VTILSTMHDASLVQNTRRKIHSVIGLEMVSKLAAVEDCNKFMSGVDKFD